MELVPLRKVFSKRIFCKHGSANTHQRDLTTLPGNPTGGMTVGFLTGLNT